MPNLTAAGPVLVHFLDFAQLNSIRTLPYLVEWDRRYREAGLTTIGVQAPRFPFGADRTAVAIGLGDLSIEFPVAIDADHALWQAYGCEGWPSLFLWTTGGALSWFHFGEGEYLNTELAIQEELRELDALRSLPEPMGSLRPSDTPQARVMPPTPEIFPGGSWDQPWVASAGQAELEIDYAAAMAAATVEGSGELRATIDGRETYSIEIDGSGLHVLAEHDRHERHHLTLATEGDLRVWSISFAAGLP